MKFVIIALILLIGLCNLSHGAVEEGGIDVVVTGGGTEGSDVQSPSVGPNNPASPAINNYRNPNQYQVPTIRTNRTDPKKNETTGAGNYSIVTEAPMIWRMNSSVEGVGNFSEWTLLSNSRDQKSKLTSSAVSGDLRKSSRVAFIQDQSTTTTTNYRAGVISIANSLYFLGDRYSEKMTDINRGDFIQNSYRTGAISKDATYIGYFMLQDISDQEHQREIYNQSTTYSLLTRYVGISDLRARMNTSSSRNATARTNPVEIYEEYAGNMALNLYLSNVISYSNDKNNTGWLPCCSEEPIRARPPDWEGP